MLKAPLARLSEPIYGLFRIVFGVLFAFHGAQKLLGLFGGQMQPVGTQLWGAGVIELVGGVLIAIGFLAGLAAFIASGEMAFAYFIAHAPKGTWPILNGGEVAILYCFAFLYIASRGSGALSIDGKR
jgi:putative oxidoreductase